MANNILVTGATGANGQLLLARLSSIGFQARAMVRPGSNIGTISSLPGIETVEGDFNNQASLARALDGIDKAFLLTNSSELAEEQQLRFVETARQSGVKHIVKLSQYAAEKNSPVRFLHYHAVVEAAIRDSGMDFTFLRPNLYMQGLLLLKGAIQSQGKIYAPIGDARISLIDVRDITAVAAICLTESGHNGKTYNLTGPNAITHADIAETLSVALGKPILFVDISTEDLLQFALSAGMPQWQAEGLMEDYAHYKRGEAASVEDGVLEATGKPPKSFEEFTKDYAHLFASKS